MKRSHFIQKLIAVFGLSVLPSGLIKHYHKIYLLQSFIRGFRFYEGTKLLSQMQEESTVKLVREPANEHDCCAIAIYFEDKKIGYVPRESNEMLSRLLDAEVIDLHAEITDLKPEAAAWENVHVAIYILKEQKGLALPWHAEYLTVLEMPEYRTLKRSNNEISRVYYNDEAEEEILSLDDLYKSLVDNSKTDEVYSIIHNTFKSDEEMEDAVTNMKMVVNKNHLPPDLSNDNIIKPLDNAVVELNNIFKEDGYVVANVDRIGKLSARIERFVEVTDKTGKLFYEVMFKRI